MRQLSPIDAADLEYRPDPDLATYEVALGPRAKQTLDEASAEAELAGDKFVGSQHLVLGVLKVLALSSVAPAAAEDRLAFARRLVERMPAIPDQMRNVLDYEKRLAEVGGDRNLLTWRTYAELIRKHRTREVIAEESDGSITITILNEEGVPLVQTFH